MMFYKTSWDLKLSLELYPLKSYNSQVNYIKKQLTRITPEFIGRVGEEKGVQDVSRYQY